MALTEEEKKELKKEYQKEYRAKYPEKRKKWLDCNRDKIRTQQKKWRDKNKDKMKALRNRYYEKNSDKIKERARQYYYDNREERTEKSRKWKAENQERVRSYRQAKRAYFSDLARKRVSELDDLYIKNLLTKNSDLLTNKHIPQELIELKRAEIKGIRLIKEQENG